MDAYIASDSLKFSVANLDEFQRLLEQAQEQVTTLSKTLRLLKNYNLDIQVKVEGCKNDRL